MITYKCSDQLWNNVEKYCLCQMVFFIWFLGMIHTWYEASVCFKKNIFESKWSLYTVDLWYELIGLYFIIFHTLEQLPTEAFPVKEFIKQTTCIAISVSDRVQQILMIFCLFLHCFKNFLLNVERKKKRKIKVGRRGGGELGSVRPL